MAGFFMDEMLISPQEADQILLDLFRFKDWSEDREYMRHRLNRHRYVGGHKHGGQSLCALDRLGNGLDW